MAMELFAKPVLAALSVMQLLAIALLAMLGLSPLEVHVTNAQPEHSHRVRVLAKLVILPA